MRRVIKLSLITAIATSSLFGAMDSNVDINISSLKSASVSNDVDGQLEKLFKDVREFHIFRIQFSMWSGMDTFTTLVTGQNGFPIFSARSDKDPKYTDYPIDYQNNMIKRYHPVRPPKSALKYYKDNSIKLGDAKTSTYSAPIVAGGTIGKGRVLVMGSHLYDSILVNPRNYSHNANNRNKNAIVDTPDMENFFHNSLAWLSEQNPDENLRYSRTGDAIKILSNKNKASFVKAYMNGTNFVPFKIHSNFKIASDENPRYIATWKEASDDGLLSPEKYPIIILEDFQMRTSFTSYSQPKEERDGTVRRTAMDEVELIVDYIQKGGGLLIMESPEFADELGVKETASNEILKRAGITNYFTNNKSKVKLLPNKNEVGGVARYDMCVADYIGHTDLVRRLEMTDYSNVPTTLEGLKTLLDDNKKLVYLEEVLQRRKRNIFKEGNSSNALNSNDCSTVEVTLENGSKSNIQTNLVKGNGILEQNEYDRYAKYPIDLNFVQAQGDMGGSMNTLLAHELKEKLLSQVDLNREYTNMSALLLNDAVFSGEKFKSLIDLLNEYKAGGRFVNDNGEFNPIFSFSQHKILDYRANPVTRIMLERAFYDKNLKYNPSEFPGQTTSVGGSEIATIYLKRNTAYQKWYAGNMQSTGLYAPAHQDITVTLPDGVDETKIQLQIGVGDNVGGIFRHEIALKRPPKYVKKYKFMASSGNYTKTITIQHPYGGLIFLKSFDSSKAEDKTADISFTGVQKAVRFVLGKTTESEWNTLRSNATAPKAELESKHHIITVAKANMENLSFEEVTKLAQDYDQEAQNAYDFYGYDRECSEPYNEHTPPSCSNEKKMAHKNREVFDPHISIGSGHSGYPVMVMNWSPTKTTFPQNPKNSWLLWHEGGHNMVESWLGIPGATEVANNVMCLYQQKRFNQTLRTEESISVVSGILAKGQPWADGGNFGRLLMFHQLSSWVENNYMNEFKSKNPKYYENGNPKTEYPFLDGNGFDIYKILHREARDRTRSSDKYDNCMKQNGATKTDMLALCTSTILELNTKPFFQVWGAGVIGIGAVNGVNIYDSTGSITQGLNTGYSTAPTPSIESFSGN
jgi:accessory colonization factor AcfD